MLLRKFDEKDSPRLVAILNHPQVIQFLSTKIPVPYTQKDAHWWINEGSTFGFIRAIEVDGSVVGCIGVNRGEFEYSRSGEIGYWLAPAYWRQGIMKQAISEVVSTIFNTTDIVRIFASVFSENTGSRSLLINCGFEAEGVHKDAIFKKGRFYDNHVFAIRKPNSKTSTKKC